MSFNTHLTMPTFGPLASHAAPYLKLSLPAKFYNVPADAPALFSTRNGTRVKRQLLSPPPAPVVRSDFDEEVKRMAALLRKELPQVAGLIRNPTSWKDLYYFFDSVDLWVEGAVFLYFVISHISKDNVIAEDAHYKMRQSAMIFQYAGNWVADNANRVVKLPTDTDFLNLFDALQRADIRGFKGPDLEAMREAIRYHHARLREKYSSATRTQCINPSRQTTTNSANKVQKCSAPYISQAQPIPSALISAPDMVDQDSPNVELIPSVVNTQTTACSQVIEPQCMRLNATQGPARAPSVSHKESSDRGHGYSEGSGSDSRLKTTGYLPQGRFKSPSAEQRVAGNASYGSPRRTATTVGKPVYIHNSQRVSAARFQDAATHTRNYSEPYTCRNSMSNDARLWHDSQLTARQTQIGHERSNKQGMQYNSYHQRSLSAPFKDHPDATVTGKTSTFYYKKEAMDQQHEFDNNRTLYIHGIPIDMFASHTLKDMMSEVGTVESISYLYCNPVLGPAFVTFAEESAIQAGIARFNGLSMHSGRQLEVKLPEKNYKFSRDRSNSQSNQIYANYNPTYSGRHSSRSFRKNSISSRQYNRPYQASDSMQCPDNPPNAFKNHNGARNLPLHDVTGSVPYTMPIPVEHLHSSISEIMQHQTALDRLIVAQMPREKVDRYSCGNRKSTGPLYEKFGFNKKENSPVKSASKDTTPDVTPNKLGFHKHMSAPHTPEEMSSNHQSIDLVETLRASARQKSLVIPPNIDAFNNESGKSTKHFTADIPQPYTSHVSIVKVATESKTGPTMVKSDRPTGVTASMAVIESTRGGQRPDGGVKSKKPYKNKKKQANLRRENSDSSKGTAATTVTSVDTTSPTLTDSTYYKSTGTPFSEVSSRNHSYASAKSIVSLSNTNDSPVDESLPSTPTPVTKHSKVSSTSSSSSSMLTPKAVSSGNQHGSQAFKNQRSACDVHSHTVHTTEATKSSNTIPRSEAVKLGSGTSDYGKSKTNEALPITFENDEEWPALDRVNVTPSRVAACKSPRALGLHALTVHHEPNISKNSNAVIPALPLNMMPQRGNSYDIAESKAWPRVRRCVGK